MEIFIKDASKKQKHFISLARNVANQSQLPDFRHGAILVRGSRVINASCNKENHCAFGARFRKRNEGVASLHAELGAILNIPRKLTFGATVYVVRIGKGGELRLSKPCSMCLAAMVHCGVKIVYYSTSENSVVRMRLK